MDLIGFTPILRAQWIECEECDATNGLGATPRLHQGTWFARNDLGRPLFWGLGQTDTTDVTSPGSQDVGTPNSGGNTSVLQDTQGNVVAPTAVTSVQSGTNPAVAVVSTSTSQPNDVTAAANDVVSYFTSNPCTTSSVAQVTAFQQAWNNWLAGGGPGVQITVDGVYGPNTQSTLQQAVANAGGGRVPSSCIDGNGNLVTPNIPSMVYTPPANWPWILVGVAALAGAGVVGYAYYKKHHKDR